MAPRRCRSSTSSFRAPPSTRSRGGDAGTHPRFRCPWVVGGIARRLMTLRTMGIAGAVAGAVALAVPMFWSSLCPEPFATIDSPTAETWVPRCFTVRGRVDPGTIRKPLWLMEGERGAGWREVGRVYPPRGTWGSRVCASRDVSEVHLALVLADDALDAKLSRPPVEEPEQQIPDWLNPRCPWRE